MELNFLIIVVESSYIILILLRIFLQCTSRVINFLVIDFEKSKAIRFSKYRFYPVSLNLIIL